MNKNSDMEITNLNNNIYVKKRTNLNNASKYIIIINIFLLSIIILLILEKFLSKNNIDIKFQKVNELLKTLTVENKNLLKLKNVNYYNKNIFNKIQLLKLFTNNNKLRYKNFEVCLLNDPDSQKCIYHLILPKNVIHKKRILIGEKGDGCYVLLNDFKDIKIAYSFGISRNIQFDKELADRGIDIFMYDHTIKSLPYSNPKFHWKKIGLCGKKKYKNLKDLETLILENGHSLEQNMILKIDIEHWEWNALNDLKEETLNQFKYIAIEFHFFDESKSNETNLYYTVLKKLEKTHQSFYFRCNGDRSRIIKFGNNRICHILEVSYIIKKNNAFTDDNSIYPISEFEYIPQRVNGKLEMNLNLLKLFK